MRLVSVVIPHYGEPGPTVALCAQLRPQLGTDHQLIVSDDHSPIPFPEIDGVRVVRRAQNGGFGTCVNSGAEAATRELLLILNSDLSVGPTFLRDLVEAAEPWQPCVAGPRLVEPYGISNSARLFPRTRFYVAEWLNPLARLHSRPFMIGALGQDSVATRAVSATPTDWVVGAAMLIPRGYFEAVGGFDEQFFMNVEEVDLQRRLAERGVGAVLLPTVEVHHAAGGSSDPERRGRWVWRSRLQYADNWGEGRVLRASLTAATGVNLMWNGARRLLGRDVHPLRSAAEQWNLIWHNS